MFRRTSHFIRSAHEVCSTAPVVFSVLWYSGRGRMPPPFRDFLISHASDFSVLKIWQTQRILPLFRGLFAPYRKMIPHASQLVSVKKENPAFACGSPVRTYFVSETPELIILPHRQLCKPPARTRSVSHRAHAVCFIAPEIFSVLNTRWTREHT